MLGVIKQSWLESGTVYGYRKITTDLRDLGERCGKHRVARLMRLEGLRSRTGYGRRPGSHGGKPSGVSPNHLQRRFDVQEPNKVWVSDITYLRTHEGGLYLAVTMDLFSRQIMPDPVSCPEFSLFAPFNNAGPLLIAIQADQRQRPPASM